MKTFSEITVLSIGDSTKLNSWSNVPYFFTKSLQGKGFKINRVNIEENKLLNTLYKYSVYALLKMVYPNSAHTYFRSGLNYFLTQRKIKKALKKYPNAGLNIYLSFSFYYPSAHHSQNLLFGDWTYLYYIRNFLKREPLWFEKKALKREKNNIENAKLVVGLFPLSSVFIKGNYKTKTCHYLGNVINSDWPLNSADTIKQKLSSEKIVFIGNQKYLNGALKLIEAFEKIKVKFKNVELHLIGLTEGQTGKQMQGLFQHGYLSKSDEAQKKLYYQTLTSAKVIVNTHPGWGAFSAITEAMYYYTPVITTAYDEFCETYGKNITFGYFADEEPASNLSALIEKVLTLNQHEQQNLMEAAHVAVKDFTWDNYTGKVLNLINKG